MAHSGADLIGAERLRQLGVEGWSHEHDDSHPEGVMTMAADCYMFLTHAVEAPENCRNLLWPFHPSWFKPSPSSVRNLVKAGALYLAEAERFDRHRKPDEAERCRATAAKIARTIDDARGLSFNDVMVRPASG